MAERWILRKGSKRSGFRYVTADGRAVRDARTLARIDALRVPPAWTDVHIAPSAAAAVQAWGFDARGRRQYRYHERATARGELRKYHRVRQMARDLPAIRRALAHDFQRRGFGARRVAAAVVRLIEEGYFRVGGDRYLKENGSHGVTTLRKSHVAVDGDCLVFDFVGKGGIRQRRTVVDPPLARFVAELRRAPGKRLFRYQDDEGAWHDLRAREVNEYLHDLVGVPYTAKDFRTWGGTLRAATVLADIGPAASEREAHKNTVLAVRLVAAELGNTPTICRKSYVHPIVLARYEDAGETISPRGGAARGRFDHAPEERALIRFLDRHFPERRRRKGQATRENDRRAA